jgi:creatinine amidohydrolase
MQLRTHWWWDLTTEEFSRLDMSSVVAVLPVGAVEQHGPHLPVRVDAAINAGIVARAVELMDASTPCLVLPMQAVGKSVEHSAFPGSLTLSYETLARVWYEIGESVHRAGCRKIIIVNSHGGQPQVVEVVVRELRVRLGMFAVSSWINVGVDFAELFDADEVAHGIHGGEIETSIMLHLHPELVDMAKADNFVSNSGAIAAKYELLRSEGPIGFGWQTQDLQPSGACGNAAAADARRGAQIVEKSARGLLKLVAEVADYPLHQICDRTAYNQSK